MKRCKHCGRVADFDSDQTCAKGGYCEWERVSPIGARITRLNGAVVTPMDVPWAEGNGIMGRRMSWAFPNAAIVEGLEVQPKGSSYHGFIDSIRVGIVDYLHIGPYPILMWSPGMPEVTLWIPHVPKDHGFTIETRDFYGKIRPCGIILNP